MVLAQYLLLTKGLDVDHLRLVMGTSMGCMHTFMWGETYPDFMDALMPLACLPVQIAGRNRLWRDLTMDAIRNDPQWLKGDYTTEPMSALRTVAGLLLIAGSAPIQMQITLPTRDAADEFLEKYMPREMENLDANDFLYQVNASRDYDPSPGLEKIKAPLLQINSADDFINPPELGIAEREIKRVKNGRFILLPASDQTHGHGTHTWAAVWQQYLAQLLRGLEELGRKLGGGGGSHRLGRSRRLVRNLRRGGGERQGRVDLVDQRIAFARQHGAGVTSRQIVRKMHRTEAHPHQPAHDDAASRKPMPHLRRTGRAHRDIEPMIEAFAILGVGLQECSSPHPRNRWPREIPRRELRSADRAFARHSRRSGHARLATRDSPTIHRR